MIIGYVGTRGRGKTLSCVREAYEHQMKGYSIYSNIHLNKKYFPHAKPLDKQMIMDLVNNEVQFRKAFFLLDEIHVYLDSRMGMSKRNLVISYFILQTRKRDVRIGYTTQFSHQVDKRLRDPTEIYVMCQNMNNGTSVIQQNLVWRKETDQKWWDTFRANDYFDYYDTDEIVNPF